MCTAKPHFPPQRECMEGRWHPWLFHNSRKIDYALIYAREVLHWNNLQKWSVILGFIFCVSEDPENVRSLVTSLPKFPLFSTLCVYVCVCVCVCVCVNSHVFVCLLCHRWPKLEPQECEITSTRGISRLYRAEKVCFCQTTQSISIPDQLCLLPTSHCLPIS